MKAYKCDRCGKLFETYKLQGTSNFFNITRNPCMSGNCLDLCPSCNAELQAWVSDDKEQESPVTPLCDDESSGWVPVSERLPELGECVGDVAKYYLVQNEYGDMLVARYTHGRYWEQIYQHKPYVDEIVAWRPLPTKYDPQESEGKK